MSPQRPDAAPAVKPIEVSADLKALMRRLKLGQLLDTLPERLALARTNRLPHHDFLELLFTDEVTRRDRESAARRAKAAHLDPAMQLQAWDDSTAVAFDQQLWAELTSMRFLADAYNVLVMGPVGVGKTFLANALGHIAVRKHHSVHTERADKLFKRLRGARLDGSYEDEMRTASSYSSSTIWPCTGWKPPRPPTSTRSSSNATAPLQPSSPATANPPKS
jgi:DNA replication protein DnaC